MYIWELRSVYYSLGGWIKRMILSLGFIKGYNMNMNRFVAPNWSQIIILYKIYYIHMWRLK